jgi:hypothetical protein
MRLPFPSKVIDTPMLLDMIATAALVGPSRQDATWLNLDEACPTVGWRAGGVASLVVGFDCHDPIAARIANELRCAAARLGLSTVPVVTGSDSQPSSLLVVAADGRVRTTTSQRARRWAPGTARHRAGEDSEDAPATPR